MLNVVVIGRFRAECADRFHDAMEAVCAATRGEPGCAGITWGLTGNDREFAVVERFADEAALEAHHIAPHMARLGPALTAMFDGPAQVLKFVENGEL